MDYKMNNVPTDTVSRDLNNFTKETGNIYESVMIISKRANHLGQEIKEELEKKLQEFATYTDNLEEVFENREQIEISRFYEKQPKPTLVAIKEFEEGKLVWRNPVKDKSKF